MSIETDKFIKDIEIAIRDEDVPLLMKVWFDGAKLLVEVDAKWVELHRFRVYDILMHGGIEDPEQGVPAGTKLH